MPWDNLPESKWPEMERCVNEVMAQGHDKESATAICYNSVMDKARRGDFAVFKQADGRYRWVVMSSSSFEDRDGQIVSQQAQEQDIARMDATGEYGVLDWWHTGIPLGDCDFAAMHDKVRIESGTFRDPRVGQRVAAKAKELAVSLAFFYPRDAFENGVFKNMATFARSLLPRGRESNLLTAVYVQQGELFTGGKRQMVKEKLDALKALLGGNGELAQSVLAQAEQAQKAAEGQGIAHKEESAAPAPEAKEDMPMEGEPPAESSAEPVAETPAPDMAAMIGQAVASAIEPLVKQVGSMSASMAEMSAKLAGYEALRADQMKAAQKEADVQRAALVQAQKATADALATLDKRVKELEGETPKAFRERRASQSKETAIQPTPEAAAVAGFLKTIDEKILGGLPGV